MRSMSINLWVNPHNVPHPAEAHQRNTRSSHSASLAYLVEQCSTIYKFFVAGERHEARRMRWSLRTL
jgi:hypothetical protein